MNNDNIGVLLVNLGTPDEPTPKSVRRYLREFLSDPRVVEFPRALWWLVLNGIILLIRPPRVAKAYASIWQKSGSPLMSGSKGLAAALQQQLELTQEGRFKVKLGMTYGNPSIASQLDAFMQDGVKKVLVLPLYPQYSATTTAASYDAVNQWMAKNRNLPEIRYLRDYHQHPLYINAITLSIKQYLETHPDTDKVLFSYHGIPQRYADNGDPYPQECDATTEQVKAKSGIDSDKFQHCYQSRFGREPWLQPYTDHYLASAPASGTKKIVVLCPGFSIDCLETLEEIAVENRDVFLEAGGERYDYIPCLNDSDPHTRLMQKLVEENTLGW